MRRHRYTGTLSFYRCWTPGPVSLSRLIAIASARWRIEEDHQLAKQSTGLDAGQVIRWKSWHRWTAICLLAYICLAVAVAVQRQQEASSGLDAGLIPVTIPELLGSRLLCAGLAGDLLWLAFALSRRWAPCAKWRGTAFRSLPVAARLGPLLDAAAAPGWRERENALVTACEVLLGIQREQGQPAPESAVIPFFDRPYRTVDQAVPQGLLAGITDPDVARLPPTVGSIEQWVDCTDVLSSPGRRAALQTAYRAWAGAG